MENVKVSNVALIDTASKDIGLKFRKPTVGPELEMVHQFIERFVDSYKNKQNRVSIFIEPLVEQAYPDIVIAEYNPKAIDQWRPSRNNINVNDLKVLQNIRTLRGVNANQIVDKTNFSYKTILQAIEKLFDAGLIDRKGERWVAKSLRDTYFLKSIVTVEAKLNQWDSLLNQAHANKWFSSESYALSAVKQPKETTLNRFRTNGIGLYRLNGNGIVEIHKAEKQALPKNHISWMFNEWVGRYETLR
ncbi:helix-turn-helix transcriptional regulator [Methylophaga nitratireducenticrescens]|uniref:helix-turn-helix transcriptional regulator n=1 Tax=Methylophaga nitratireducenticrescens TaxID=754476 RepID=UPI00146CE0CB|nr:helix-turn-helix transcriptional regulator [Methylophaga nitratireducenticrescens]